MPRKRHPARAAASFLPSFGECAPRLVCNVKPRRKPQSVSHSVSGGWSKRLTVERPLVLAQLPLQRPLVARLSFMPVVGVLVRNIAGKRRKWPGRKLLLWSMAHAPFFEHASVRHLIRIRLLVRHSGDKDRLLLAVVLAVDALWLERIKP